MEALKRARNGVQTSKSEEGAAGTLPGKVTDGNAHVIGLTIGYKF